MGQDLPLRSSEICHVYVLNETYVLGIAKKTTRTENHENIMNRHSCRNIITQ